MLDSSHYLKGRPLLTPTVLPKNVKSTAGFLDLSHPHQGPFTRRFVVTQPGFMAAVAVIWVKTTKSFFPPLTFNACSLPSSCRRGVEIYGAFFICCCSLLFLYMLWSYESKEDQYFLCALKGVKDEGVMKYTRHCVCKLRFLDTIFAELVAFLLKCGLQNLLGCPELFWCTRSQL